MNAKEFLTKLRETPRVWLLMVGGKIRLPNGLCPIEALLNEPNQSPSFQTHQGAYSDHGRLGMTTPLAIHIIRAADGYTDGPWRRDLLEACGLTQ